MRKQNILFIGSRKSKLALEQTQLVVQKITSTQNIKVEVVEITTSGDKFLDIDPSQYSGKDLFTKELEEALLQKRIDMAVHSLKDMPAVFSDKLILSSFLNREDPRDVFISSRYNSIAELSNEASIGTSSIRRRVQMPGYNYVSIRGNIERRIQKSLDLDGIILAYAGIKRLNMEYVITEIMDIEFMLPAIGQGIICIQTRKDDKEINEIAQSVECCTTALCAKTERYFMELINGNCNTPMAGLAEIIGNTLKFTAMLANKHGVFKLSASTYNQDDYKLLVRNLTNELIDISGYLVP